MLRLLSFVALCLFLQPIRAQFGPGGVGSSTSNGLWLRADDITGVLDGDPVATWSDFSGNGNDAGNTVAGRQPLFFSTSSINGRPIIRLDGIDDQMIVPDADILDNSTGITWFSILRPNNLNGSARGIIGKRITYTVSVEYAYTFFFWTFNYLNLDIHTQNNRFSTDPIAFSNANNYLLGFTFDGSLPAAQRSKIYSQGNLIRTANEASTTLPNSNQDLVIGALNVDYGIYLGADFGELIHYNYTLNEAERIIVENYLGAKYNLPIANDFFSFETTHGNEVAGIGRINGSILHNDSQGSSFVRINNPSNLGNNEYLIWGHDNASIVNNNIVDVDGATIEARLNRVWRADETGEVGTVDLSFDLSTFSPFVSSDLRLLIDRDGDGFFDNDIAPKAGTYSAPYITFSSVDLEPGDFFTLGSINALQSPLPVELLEFKGSVYDADKVLLQWKTASESNSLEFEVIRNTDSGQKSIAILPAAGFSSNVLSYENLDPAPESGLNYYSLVQKDRDGQQKIFGPIVIDFKSTEQIPFVIYPNPVQGNILSFKWNKKVKGSIQVLDATGKLVYQEVNCQPESISTANWSPGIYHLSFVVGEKIFHHKFILDR